MLNSGVADGAYIWGGGGGGGGGGGHRAIQKIILIIKVIISYMLYSQSSERVNRYVIQIPWPLPPD